METRIATSTITPATSHSSGPRPPTPKGWPDEEAAFSTVIVTVFVSEKPIGPGSTALNVTAYTTEPWLLPGVQTKLPRTESKEAPEGRPLAERVAKSSATGFVALTEKVRVAGGIFGSVVFALKVSSVSSSMVQSLIAAREGGRLGLSTWMATDCVSESWGSRWSVAVKVAE